MQPTFLPWLGYFALIDRVDTFVFLDSVQFEKRSWQQRNRIKTPQGEHWLTIPVSSKHKFHQIIHDVKIVNVHQCYKKHIRTIDFTYRKAPYYSEIRELIFSPAHYATEYLFELNITLIYAIRQYLGLHANFINSSSLNVTGKKDTLLAAICQQLSATTYISPPGSENYLKGSEAFNENQITIQYNTYNHPQYSQLHGKFIPYLSVIDLLFNEGPDSMSIIRQGIC